MHQSVLLNETLSALDLAPGDLVVDGTVDGGGHAAAILEKIGENGKLLGIDWDPALLEECRKRLGQDPRVTLRHGNYANAATFLKEANLPKANAFLLDLGFSSEQLQGKGLSFLKDEPLTMTYDPEATPAYQILRELSEGEMIEMIRELGEERYAARIGQAIYARERRSPIVTTGDLEAVIREAVPGNYERGRLNPATRTFQALRIYANNELGNLREALRNLPEIVGSGGRVAMISFHSLEDRIVKHVFREMEKQGFLKILTKKPIEATDEEIYNNARSRSAKLRVAIMN